MSNLPSSSRPLATVPLDTTCRAPVAGNWSRTVGGRCLGPVRRQARLLPIPRLLDWAIACARGSARRQVYGHAVQALEITGHALINAFGDALAVLWFLQQQLI